MNLFSELQQKHGLTYLFISHDLSVISHVSDRVAVMYLGRLVELASRERLAQPGLHPYTEALLAAVPVADPHRRLKPPRLAGDPPSPLRIPPGCPFHPPLSGSHPCMPPRLSGVAPDRARSLAQLPPPLKSAPPTWNRRRRAAGEIIIAKVRKLYILC